MARYGAACQSHTNQLMQSRQPRLSLPSIVSGKPTSPVPTRVPTLEEMPVRDQALFRTGQSQKPGAPIPRRFLEAIDARPYPSAGSGRRELAESILSDSNPLNASRTSQSNLASLVGSRHRIDPDNLDNWETCRPIPSCWTTWLSSLSSKAGRSSHLCGSS